MMARRLIVCCDGTWCDPDLESVTNVRRLYNALSTAESSGRPQLAYYRPGVGTTGGLVRRVLAGALGTGLSEDIIGAYQWLATTYRPGDSIALFGFSRGAYTARSLGGLIKKSGLPDLGGLDARAAGQLVDRAYSHYRDGDSGNELWREGLDFSYDAHDEAGIPVDFIGVWDTVGSLGVPDYLAGLSALDPARRYNFHDVLLNPFVKHARHALALDEWRRPFTPTLWQSVGDQDVEQRWFPGSHMDVGGGHPETGLSDLSLNWMIDEAVKTVGLGFHQPTLAKLAPDPEGLLHDDDRGVVGVAPPLVDPLLRPLMEVGLQFRPRAVPAIVAANGAGQGDPAAGVLDDSVLARQQAQPITSGPYRPTRVLGQGETATVEVQAHELWNDTGLYLEPGAYRFAPTGQWRSGSAWSGPGGAVARPGTLRRTIGSAVGEAVGLYRRVFGQRHAHAPLAPRELDMPWMSLVGYVANASVGAEDDPHRDHERVEIGTGVVQEVARAGYFYAFANDAWGFYGNNAGTVTLTVTRR